MKKIPKSSFERNMQERSWDLQGEPKNTVQGWSSFLQNRLYNQQGPYHLPCTMPWEWPPARQEETEGRKGTCVAPHTLNLSFTGQKAKSRVWEVTFSEKAWALRLGKCQSPSKIRHLISHLRITSMNEIPLAKCCLTSATTIKLSPGGKVYWKAAWWKRLGFREQKTNETIKLLWGEMNRDLGWRDAKNKGEESNGRKRKQKTEQMACIRGTML